MDHPAQSQGALGTFANSDEVGYHYRLGNQHLYENRLDAAIREYQRVVLLNPGHVQAHFELGTAYFRQGSLEMAVRAWQEVCALVPNFVRAHYNLGLAYERLGKRDKAVTELQVALKVVQNQIADSETAIRTRTSPEPGTAASRSTSVSTEESPGAEYVIAFILRSNTGFVPRGL